MATWPAGPCGPQAGTQPASWLDPLKEENAKKALLQGLGCLGRWHTGVIAPSPLTASQRTLEFSC